MASIRLWVLQTRDNNHRSIAEWVALVPFGVFCFVYPFAMLLMSFDLMPFDMEWMSSLLLAMLGISTGGWLWLNFGGTGASLGAAIFLIGLGLEYLGVGTGLPFGRYAYTGVLAPDLPGGVPLAIGFAWLFIVVAGLFTARWVLARGSSLHPIALAALGAVFAVSLDLLLEPVAFQVEHYWKWLDEPSGYYGVPWSNFIAWFVAALLIGAGILATLDVESHAHLRMPWLPVVLYLMNVVLFGVVNIAHAMWWPGAICLALVLAVYFTGPRFARLPRG